MNAITCDFPAGWLGGRGLFVFCFVLGVCSFVFRDQRLQTVKLWFLFGIFSNSIYFCSDYFQTASGSKQILGLTSSDEVVRLLKSDPPSSNYLVVSQFDCLAK